MSMTCVVDSFDPVLSFVRIRGQPLVLEEMVLSRNGGRGQRRKRRVLGKGTKKYLTMADAAAFFAKKKKKKKAFKFNANNIDASTVTQTVHV